MLPSARRAFPNALRLPPMQRLRQPLPRPRVIDLPAAVAQALAALPLPALAGRRIAVGVGSRGLAELPQLVAALVAGLRARGADPFILPAMGSHGGATAAGQRQVLADLGVTAAAVGAPIEAGMEVELIGRLDNGLPIWVDRLARAADGVVLLNRIKPHTDFVAPLESGLAKMAVLGLGKAVGAAAVHAYGVEGLVELMPQAARLVVAQTPILFGLASIENAFHEVAAVHALAPADIAGPREAALLQEAYALMPRFPFPEIDVLIVDEIGKNISGVGMDPNVIGRVKVHGVADNPGVDIRAIAVLNLSPETHGNASGIGLADVTTQRLVAQIDWEALYINCITAGVCGIQRGAIPVVAPDDRAAIATALRVCGQPDPLQARIVHIRSTLHLNELAVSPRLAAAPHLTPLGAPYPLTFDEQGRLTPFALPCP